VPPSAHHEAARIISAEVAMTQAQAQLTALKAQPAPTTLMDRIRWEMSIDAAAYAYREGARQEELRVYELASYDRVQSAVIPLLYVTVIRLTVTAATLLSMRLTLVSFLLCLNPQCVASISRWRTASTSWTRSCPFVWRALSSILVICMLTGIRLLLTCAMTL